MNPQENIDYLHSTPAKKAWNRIGARPHHGINIPLFSLHSEESSGIGEFLDLLPLLPWLKNRNFDILQLLPLNDSGLDSSPYNALSAFALNPLHISLKQLPRINQHADLIQAIKELKSLNQLQHIDYEKVRQEKFKILHQYYQKEAKTFFKNEEHQKFFMKYQWMQGYALFKSLKEDSGWKNWESWEESIRYPDEKLRLQLYHHYYEKINFHLFLQYFCFQQMQQVKNEAEKLGILLKGDLPILTSRESADVWLNQNQFDLNYSAGAPPDMYNSEGQNWGFPLYNWNELEKESYHWWKTRLQVSENFYHLYRLDHVVGFFRIWAFPIGKSAQEAHFIPFHFDQWMTQGRKIMLQLLANSRMLPIGEDLGTVPPEVRLSLKELGICGTKVMRWERMWNEDKRFIDPSYYSPISMTTVSTHDSETLQLWWTNQPDEAKEFCKFKNWIYTTPLSTHQQIEILRDSHRSGSLFHINLLQEYLTIFPELRWPTPEDERINIPGTISKRNWSYKFKPSVEEIISHQGLAKVLDQVINH